MNETLPFWKDKTFWLSVMTLIAGVVLALTGNTELGQLLLVGGAVGAGITTMRPGTGGTKAAGVLIALICLAGACTPHMAFVEAEQAVYDVVAPEYLGYVHADPNMDAEEIARRVNMIECWRVSLEAAGGVKP